MGVCCGVSEGVGAGVGDDVSGGGSSGDGTATGASAYFFISQVVTTMTSTAVAFAILVFLYADFQMVQTCIGEAC